MATTKSKRSATKENQDNGSTAKEGMMIMTVAVFLSSKPGQAFTPEQILEDYLVKHPREGKAAVHIGKREIVVLCMDMMRKGYVTRDDDGNYTITEEGLDLIK
jgi:hypothetical protein